MTGDGKSEVMLEKSQSIGPINSPGMTEDPGGSEKQLSRTNVEGDQPALEAASSEAHSEEEQPLEEWNKPRKNIIRIVASCYSFLILGMMDSANGALIPTLEKHYNLSYLVVSITFLAPFCGYSISAMLNEWIHKRIGRWGVGLLGTSCQLICNIINVTAPPFPVYVVAFGIAGFGNGTIDAAWNSWMGSLKQANQTMGVLHGLYGLGGILCPTIFTSMIDNGIKWNYGFAVLIGLGVTVLVAIGFAFWGDNAQEYRKSVAKSRSDSGAKGGNLFNVLKNPVVAITAGTLFMYVGGEVAMGGWVSTYMIDVRGGNPLKMGYVTTGYWVGITVGRFVLGFVTGHFKHEEILFVVYLAGAIVFEVLFWAVPSFALSAVSAGVIGFFLGPLFPTIIIVAVKKLPKWLHVSGVGFAAALGGGGAGFAPFIIGIIANSKGAHILAPFVFALMAGQMVLWLVMLKFF
uniref:ARAD1C16346p n=1 Tax=Blastobotrys adeninivorans TaxID=409370 RepID=A0A060T0Y5_BLAAD